MQSRKKTLLASIFLLAAILIGFIAGWHTRSNMPTSGDQIRANVDSFKFINPLLLSGNDSERTPELEALRKQLDSSVSAARGVSGIQSVSVYFRDLNTGHWTGVNEDDLYVPSSMLKVITMMAALKPAETDPRTLEKRIYYTPDESTARYRPNDHVASGYYTVSDLIHNMIVYSDNASNAALLSDSDINSSFNVLYSIFRLPRNPAGKDTDPDFMSAKSYSLVFRVLYNSTLFQWHLSEQVLDLLSQTKFVGGLVAGVPQGTMVSHKFGEAAYDEKGATVRELHDCGIVYYPEHPYFLCVMTKGSDPSTLQDTIAHISAQVWSFATTSASKKTN